MFVELTYASAGCRIHLVTTLTSAGVAPISVSASSIRACIVLKTLIDICMIFWDID